MNPPAPRALVEREESPSACLARGSSAPRQQHTGRERERETGTLVVHLHHASLPAGFSGPHRVREETLARNLSPAGARTEMESTRVWSWLQSFSASMHTDRERSCLAVSIFALLIRRAPVATHTRGGTESLCSVRERGLQHKAGSVRMKSVMFRSTLCRERRPGALIIRRSSQAQSSADERPHKRRRRTSAKASAASAARQRGASSSSSATGGRGQRGAQRAASNRQAGSKFCITMSADLAAYLLQGRSTGDAAGSTDGHDHGAADVPATGGHGVLSADDIDRLQAGQTNTEVCVCVCAMRERDVRRWPAASTHKID